MNFFATYISLAGNGGQDILLFTMNITSFYTVLPKTKVPHIFLDQRTVGEPSSKTLLRLGELLLTLNCFLFCGNYYKQTNGVAMGPKMRPSYANLYIGVIEHQFLSQ